MPGWGQSRIAVTVYVKVNGDAVIREEMTMSGRRAAQGSIVRAGTSPEWRHACKVPDETIILDAAWTKACNADPSLRPVREWKRTNDVTTMRMSTGPDTTLNIRMSRDAS